MSSSLIQLGDLLLDPSTVCAILPITTDQGKSIDSFRIVTTGGSLDITDLESGEAIRRYFWPGPSPRIVLNSECDRQDANDPIGPIV